MSVGSDLLPPCQDHLRLSPVVHQASARSSEFDQMDADARARSGGLIDPQVVVDAVLELADDPDSAGRIVIVRAGRRPYAIDPAASDPLSSDP